MAEPGAAPIARIRFTINDAPVELDAPGGRRLLDVLRTDLGLTGTKEGCGEGECGACSVLIDGEVVLSCLIPVGQAAGCDIRTVEGLALGGRLSPLQTAFLQTGGAQCGICTPGMLMAARAFLDSGSEPTDDAIREAIAGNLCRCTGYTKIVAAIALASRLALADGGATHDRSPGVGVPGIGVPGGGPPRRVASSLVGPAILSARTLGDAVRMMAELGARPIAGGTDVMVGLAAGTGSTGPPLIDIRGLDELRGIDRAGDELILGALTSYTELRRSSVVAGALPVLALAAATIGAVQIQNRGTIGGNVVNASPAGDLLPVLLATDAAIDLTGPDGERTVPAGEFWIGYRRTACAADELVTRIRIPLVAGRQVRYRKVAARRAQAISKVVVALAWRAEGSLWRDVRVGLGSVAERPIRATAAEAVLEGIAPGPEVGELAAATIEAEIQPIDDVRSTAVYRRTVTGRVVRRMILDAVDR